jgi:glycosyltransferase involved in cell wall biosynthesis
MAESRVAIVIPAYNEAATITDVVTAVLPYGLVIVVDDCSTDETGLLADKAGALVVRQAENGGYDKALDAGFIEADRQACDYAITFDADGQHQPSLLQRFIDTLDKDYDLVVGIRPESARFAEKIFALYTRVRFGLHDPLCGMKGYRMALYREYGCFDSCGSIGTELALYALSRHKKWTEFAIPVAVRGGDTKARFGDGFRPNYIIFCALLRSFFCHAKVKTRSHQDKAHEI